MVYKSQKIIVTNSFHHFLPKEQDFELVAEDLRPINNGEFLVKAEYLSVDPYMRSFHDRRKPPYTQFGFQVGKVVETKDPNYPVDSYVVSHSQWSTYVILDSKPDSIFHVKPYIPDLGTLPLSYSLGAVGMPGITAYLGFTQLCKAQANNVFCVTSAAGAIGSIVGQLAKLQGCTVIAFTGRDEKVQYLKEELGFDHVFNYKTTKHRTQKLKKIAPEGIDIYFDNVGGELSYKILECMRENGRVVICGTISSYGGKFSSKKCKIPLDITSFSFTQWDWELQKSALDNMKRLLLNETIKVKETITEGFENTPRAFIGMLEGDNVGKALVKL